MPNIMQPSTPTTQQQRFEALVAIASGLAASGHFSYSGSIQGFPNGIDSAKLVNAATELLMKIEERLL